MPHRLVAGNREEPGADPPLSPETRSSPERCQERLLENVLGDRIVPRERAKKAEQRAGMGLDEFRERVAIPSGRFFQSAPIG